MQVFAHAPRDRHTVVGARATTDFVQQHQRAPRRGMQNSARFTHLHHKRGLSAHQIVAGANASEQAVDNGEFGAARRHVAAHLRHELNESDLPQNGALTGHVGPGQHDHLRVFAEREIIGNELLARHHALDHRMAARHDLHIEAVVQLRSCILFTLCHVGKRGQHINRRHATCHLLPTLNRRSRLTAQRVE